MAKKVSDSQVAGIKAHAEAKNKETIDKVNKAIDKLKRKNKPINFETVCKEAGVSRATLYNNVQLKERILSVLISTPRTLGFISPLFKHSSNSSDDKILRSPALTPVKAFMCEKTMRLDFSSSIKDVIITVVNASTGEVVYSENFATPEVVFINLDAEEAGDYRLDVTGDATALWAEFSL